MVGKAQRKKRNHHSIRYFEIKISIEINNKFN